MSKVSAALPCALLFFTSLTAVAQQQLWDETRGCFEAPQVMETADGVEFVRTPPACFSNLPGFPYRLRTVEIDGLRQGFIDEGPRDADPILLLHGQPTWSYLYRKMIPFFLAAGHRVVAMDHVGLGNSDKPTDIAYYTYLGHTDRLEKFIDELDLQNITLFVQDWGSLIGLRVAGENTERFARIVMGNGTLPVFPSRPGAPLQPPIPDPYREDPDVPDLFLGSPEQQPFMPTEPNAEQIAVDQAYDKLGLQDFARWQYYTLRSPKFRASKSVEAATYYDLPDAVEAAYDAPFPSRIYMAAIRAFPSLAPGMLLGVNDEAWEGLQNYQKPFLTIIGVRDTLPLGSEANQRRFIENVPGAAGQSHVRLEEAAHFLQEDQGPDIARRVVEFIEANPR
ncbi:MAG: haloalkane dehalogenase [Pseudohongiellaceae bacterium]|jgi:haloalkane dehalogenase